MPPATIGFKAETLPSYSVSQAKSTDGVRRDRLCLSIDLYYRQRRPALHARSKALRGHRQRPYGAGFT